MPLSDHEQRLLDQMEQQLYADDPKFVSRLNEDPKRTQTRKKAVIGVLIVVVGLALVLLGVQTQQIWLGGVGFAVMVVGGAYALTPGRGGANLGAVNDQGQVTPHRKRRGVRRPGSSRSATGSSRSTAPAAGTFMERMERRWDRRRGQDGW